MSGVDNLSMHDLQYLRWKVNFQRKQIDAPADMAHSGGGAMTGGSFHLDKRC